MEIPNWVKWFALAGLVVWVITDPASLGRFLADFAGGIGTAFKAAF